MEVGRVQFPATMQRGWGGGGGGQAGTGGVGPVGLGPGGEGVMVTI